MQLGFFTYKNPVIAPMHGQIERSEKGTRLKVGPSAKPCYAVFHRDTPPETAAIGQEQYEVDKAHVFVHHRNFLVLSENRPQHDTTLFFYFRTLVPFKPKNKLIHVFNNHGDLYTQRIYCDSVVSYRNEPDGLRFHGFCMLKPGDYCRIAHHSALKKQDYYFEITNADGKISGFRVHEPLPHIEDFSSKVF